VLLYDVKVISELALV